MKKQTLSIVLSLVTTAAVAAPSIVELAGGKANTSFKSEITAPPGAPAFAQPPANMPPAVGMPMQNAAPQPVSPQLNAAAPLVPMNPALPNAQNAAASTPPAVTPQPPAMMTMPPQQVTPAPQIAAPASSSNMAKAPAVDPFNNRTNNYEKLSNAERELDAMKRVLKNQLEIAQMKSTLLLMPAKTELDRLKILKEMDKYNAAAAPAPAPVMPVAATQPKTTRKHRKRPWKPNIRYLGYVEGDGQKTAYLKVGSRYHQVHAGERVGRYTVAAISEDQVSVKYKGRTYRFDRKQKDYRIEAKGAVVAAGGGPGGLNALRQMLNAPGVPGAAGIPGIPDAPGMPPIPGAPGVPGMPTGG